MKRFRGIPFWLLALLLWLPGAAQGQVLIALIFGDKVSNERFQLGINVSAVGSAFMGFQDSVRIDWSMSIYGEIALHRRFHLLPCLALKYPGGAKDMTPSLPGYPFKTIGEPTFDQVVTEGEVRRELRYLSLPVIGRVLVGPLGIGAGPQIGVLLTADDVASRKDGGTRISLKHGVVDELRRVDFGFVMSLDYSFWPAKAMRSMRLRGSGYVGVVDTIKKGDSAGGIRNWNVMLGLDIPIGGPKKAPQNAPAPLPVPVEGPQPGSPPSTPGSPQPAPTPS